MKIDEKLLRDISQYLEAKQVQDQIAAQLLTKIKKDSQNNKKRRGITFNTSSITSLIVLGYFIAVFFLKFTTRITLEELLLVAIILFFTSDLTEKIQEFVVGKDGLSVKILQDKVEEVEKKVETNKATITAHEGAIKRIADPEAAINRISQSNVSNSHQELEKQILERFVDNENELKHLYRLYRGERKQEPVRYEKRQSFEIELRRLRTQGLIINHEDKPIGTMASEGDLRDYIKLTPRGIAYVESRIKLGLNNPLDDRDSEFWSNVSQRVNQESKPSVPV